ncbi:MAG: hypothetical protein V7707_06015 [Motiliproteus sp.]
MAVAFIHSDLDGDSESLHREALPIDNRWPEASGTVLLELSCW